MAAEDNRPTKHKTCRRINETGHAHGLTFSCFRQQKFLLSDRARNWLIESLIQAKEKFDFELWAYVIMPEHCHVIVCPNAQPYSISKILWQIKTPVARWARAYLEEHNRAGLASMQDEQPNGQLAWRFWQRGGGYDRNVADEIALHRMIDYIHANPVRRGLVARAMEWRWSSAQFYSGVTDVPLVMDRETLPFRPAWLD